MVHDCKNLDKYLKQHGNRYSVTVFVASKPRMLADKYDNIISHAEALTWVLSGKVPDGVLHYNERVKQRELRRNMYVQEQLSNILDEQVRNSVLKSIDKSRRAGHLIYQYDNVYDKYRQARVRILTNKIWYESRDEGFRTL